MHNLVILKKIFPVMLLPMAALAFTSCSDNTDDATTNPSSADVKWDIDEYMDTSVKPGDDFARYCWGKWYDNAGEPDNYGLGTVAEAAATTFGKVAKLEGKEMKQLEGDIDKLYAAEDGQDMDGYNEVFEFMRKLRNQLANPDALEVAKLLGKFYASGRNCMVQCNIIGNGEKNYFYFLPTSTDYISDMVTDKNKINVLTDMMLWLLELGKITEDQAKDLIISMMVDPKFEKEKDADTQYAKYNEEQITQAFCEAMGISPDQVFGGTAIGDAILQSRSMILQSMMWSLACDVPLLDKRHLDDLSKSKNMDAKTYLSAIMETSKLLDYPQSKEYCDAYCTAEHRQKVFDLMEDLRTTFNKRIDNLEWMSNTTKEAAKKKLAAMKFYALYPDHWYETGIPQLEGESLYYDVMNLRKTRRNLQKQLLKVNPREDYLNVIFASQFTASTINCFYNPVVNSVLILAPLMSEPVYSLSDPDAKLYAVGTILGHEMTHAFDNSGAKYGPKGESENWWTVSDKQDFDSRTQLLVDCYNHLPGYQDCAATTFTDGAKTLGENIADIGGLELALEAYTNKLEQQGVQGEELVKAQKRFFQAYANIWRTKNTQAHNQSLLTDSHANSYTRILGATMNCNRWYELYDVKWGDKNYLKPEKRTHIW